MKNLHCLIILFLLLFVSPQVIKGQIYLGMRDNNYAYCGLTIKNKFNVSIEHSLYSEKMSYQKIRLYVGYQQNLGDFNLKVSPYISSVWNGMYKDYGSMIDCSYNIFDFAVGDITFNPHHDSGFGTDFNYMVGIKCKVYKDLWITSHYSCIPEFRSSEKRVRLGILISVGQLSIEPCLSIATEGKTIVRSFCSFKYNFIK